MEFYEFRAMNSRITFAAEGTNANDGFIGAQTYIEDAEQRFSRFREDSELSELNRSAGTWFSASDDMISVLQIALDCYRMTEGLFNPAILPDLKSAGYTRSMDELRIHGADLEADSQSPKSNLSFDLIQLDAAHNRVLLPKEMQIDLGGIAKGWIAEQAAKTLSAYSKACGVNAGGDMFLIGHPENETGWDVGLEDPRDPSKDLIDLWVDEGAVVTSSVVKRVWKLGGKTRHHLIDPRNGEPAETDWLSVTFFDQHAATAEAFAKAILIGGHEYADRLLKRHPGLDFLTVDERGGIWSSLDQKETVYVG